MPTVEYELPSGLTPEDFSARIFGADEPVDGDTGLELVPFRGVRFAPDVVGDLAAVTSPPYDLIDEAAVHRLRASDAHNIVRLILPDGDYPAARATLDAWLASGALVGDSGPALYVYEERSSGVVVQRGLIGGVGLRPGPVLPHEDVYPGPVRDRLALMATTESNLEPIFLLYEGGGAASDLVDETASGQPILEVCTEDGITHRLWPLTDPAAHARIAADLRPRQALIADGHHRYATYRALQAGHDGPGPWDHGLALLVDSTRYPPLLGAIHRVLPDLPPEIAVARARDYFTVTRLPLASASMAPRRSEESPLSSALAALSAAGGGSAFVLAGGGGQWLLTDPDPAQLARSMPPGHSERWRRLDTAILDHLLIEHAWGIKADERSVDVVHHDAAAAIARADRTGGTAVILNPLQVDDVIAVAAGGERVPRKSTSFGPKPRTGLVLRLLRPQP
jgi:uncharacterized protein (DUF1015 family)